jgi:hypothetical protein
MASPGETATMQRLQCTLPLFTLLNVSPETHAFTTIARWSHRTVSFQSSRNVPVCCFPAGTFAVLKVFFTCFTFKC